MPAYKHKKPKSSTNHLPLSLMRLLHRRRCCACPVCRYRIERLEEIIVQLARRCDQLLLELNNAEGGA